MNLAALTIARNEEPFIGLTLRAALSWCDFAVVLLHACVDNTPNIVADIEKENPGRVTVLEAPGADTWSEMEHRQRTLVMARANGATHCAVVDADEVLSSNLLPTIRKSVSHLGATKFLGIPMKNLHNSLYQYRSDASCWGTSGTMLAFGDHRTLDWHAKDGYDHHHRSPFNSSSAGALTCEGGVLHLQFVSRRRLVAKHAWYKMIERIKHPSKPVDYIDKTYNMAVSEEGVKTSPVPEGWWQSYQPLLPYLRLDIPPWHEVACAKFLETYGADHFKGLNLFGVV